MSTSTRSARSTTERSRTAVRGAGSDRGGPGSAVTRPQAPGLVRAALMVAEREVLTQIRSKSFLISTAVLLGAILASIVLGAVLSSRESTTQVAVLPGSASAVAELEGIEGVPADDVAAARALVTDG